MNIAWHIKDHLVLDSYGVYVIVVIVWAIS